MVLTQVCSTKEKKISKENSVKSRDGKGKNFFCFGVSLSIKKKNSDVFVWLPLHIFPLQYSLNPN